MAGVAALLSVVSFVGCRSTELPRLSSEHAEQRPPSLPEGAAPVYSWAGQRVGLRSYWYAQDVQVELKAWFPPQVERATDIRWEVSAVNSEGKPLPFLGVVQPYVNENGNELYQVVPEVDLDSLPDCLYVLLEPGLTLEEGKVVEAVPTAVVTEVRDHNFKPFRVRVPLAPREVSALTPAPEPIPDAPSGTAIPWN